MQHHPRQRAAQRSRQRRAEEAYRQAQHDLDVAVRAAEADGARVHYLPLVAVASVTSWRRGRPESADRHEAAVARAATHARWALRIVRALDDTGVYSMGDRIPGKTGTRVTAALGEARPHTTTPRVIRSSRSRQGARRRRSAASSTTSSADPGDPDGEPPCPAVDCDRHHCTRLTCECPPCACQRCTSRTLLAQGVGR